MALAYYFPSWDTNDNYKAYYKEDLMNPQTVEELFDYCQILYADITKSGWEFLIEYYGFQGLYEIDQKSGWLTDCGTEVMSLEEYIQWVKDMLDASQDYEVSV